MDLNIMLCLYFFVVINLIEVFYICSYIVLVLIIDKIFYGYKVYKILKIVIVWNVYILLYNMYWLYRIGK